MQPNDKELTEIKDIIFRRGSLHVIQDINFYNESSVIECVREPLIKLKQAQDDVKYWQDEFDHWHKQAMDMTELYKQTQDEIDELKTEKQKWFDLHYTETTRADLLQEQLKAKDDEIEQLKKDLDNCRSTLLLT